MKSISKFAVLLLVAGLIMGSAGCNPNTEQGEVSFQSFSPPSIYVDNNTGEKLVAFKGSLNPNNLISGIPEYAANHGLEKKASLFSSTGDFALILITEAEYNSKKSNLASATIFAQLYAFYNNEATNNNRFQISAQAGGSGRITLNNPTDWNVEIRQDGPTGPVLGYAAATLTNTVLRVEAPGDYSLYPVFKRYNPIDREIWPLTPKYTSGVAQGRPYAKDFALAQANSNASWNLDEVLNDYLSSDITMTTGSFYLRIFNDSNTAIRFRRGDDDQVTSMGIIGIAPASSNTYFVRIGRNVDGSYPATETFSTLRIGTPQIMNNVPAHTFKLDYTYTIHVTGPDASNLVIGEIQESEGPINVDQMFGGQ